MRVGGTARWAAAVAVALAGGLAFHAATARGQVDVDIGRAVQAMGGDAAARATEQVNYDDRDLELVATYLVVDGRLQGDAPPDQQRLWATAASILPPTQLAEIRQLNVVTDGAGGTLAMVHRSGMVADRWILSMDAAEPVAVLRETLVHELAHLLTLRREDLRVDGSTCEGVRIEIGCARSGSVLAEWAIAFWPDPEHPARYDRDHFVGEYAASAVHEDLAETFLAYVLAPDEPRPPAIAAKLAFVEAHPGLAAAATEVRARLDTA
jgi:hypothetical protein